MFVGAWQKTQPKLKPAGCKLANLTCRMRASVYPVYHRVH
jgi:hypothetical protein